MLAGASLNNSHPTARGGAKKYGLTSLLIIIKILDKVELIYFQFPLHVIALDVYYAGFESGLNYPFKHT